MVAIRNGHILRCICADCQKPQSPVSKKTATTGTNHGFIPMAAIPKDVSTPPAAAAHTAHFAMGIIAASPLLNTAIDFNAFFIVVVQAQLL